MKETIQHIKESLLALSKTESGEELIDMLGAITQLTRDAASKRFKGARYLRVFKYNNIEVRILYEPTNKN